ncbi:MAG: uroporphyrinogen decarboxylase [Saprospiraceae bacterium]|nr:uroporphyrinogen decarboxylase [Saprospiraceae bacterium]
MIKNDILLRTLNGESTERPPVWFMRQAGRYLPDYLKLKEKYSFFERVQIPDLAAEITTMPVEQVGVDAAILFSDILVISQCLGHEVEMVPGVGPVIEDPVRDLSAIDRLKTGNEESFFRYATPAIKAVKDRLDGSVPLIGFCGSPWTLMCYMVEGKGSKNFAKAKELCAKNPDAAARFLDILTDASIEYLKIKIRAGVDVIQVFDSWGGLLSPEWHAQFSLPYLERIAAEISKEVPVILFSKDAWHALKGLSETKASAVGLSWTMPASYARSQCGQDMVLQGNLDPSILLTTPEVVARETTKMIDRFGTGHHIVNLGHGVLPNTPVECARAFVDTAKSYSYA